jgi:hypothetical protein
VTLLPVLEFGGFEEDKFEMTSGACSRQKSGALAPLMVGMLVMETVRWSLKVFEEATCCDG